MIAAPYLAATRPHRDAADLLATYGPHAAEEAAARAERSRQLGNHVHFCRWREVGRMIATLGRGRVSETLH